MCVGSVFLENVLPLTDESSQRIGFLELFMNLLILYCCDLDVVSVSQRCQRQLCSQGEEDREILNGSSNSISYQRSGKAGSRPIHNSPFFHVID